MSTILNVSNIPKTVWVLGFVSLFMDLSSELIHSLLPIYLVGSLGASVMTVGLIEGTAEASALIVRIFSGSLSDFIQNRKILILLGYGLAAVSKPLFPLANSAATVFFARFLDRIGKGIRGAPRDALVADISPPELRGACFGLRQSMDTIGAFLGPSLAIVLLTIYSADIQMALWFAVFPAVIAVVIGLKVSEPKNKPSTHERLPVIQISQLRQFASPYWWTVLIGSVYTLARFSEAFLLLRAQEVGMSVTWIPLVLIFMSVAYALCAYPAGILSDRLSRNGVLGIGLIILIGADILLAGFNNVYAVLLGASLWGMHMGFSQGIFSAKIADSSPASLKGTAYGIFYLISGLMVIASSVFAGLMWELYSSCITFLFGIVFSLITFCLLFVHTNNSRSYK